MINRFNFGLQPGLWEQPCLELIQQFDPAAEVVFNGEGSRDIDITYAGDILTFEGWDKAGRKHQKEYNLSGKPLEKDTFKGFLYLFLVAFFGRPMAWGSLSGVKPVKIAHQLIVKEGQDTQGAAKQMEKRYKVSPEKAMLAATLAQREMPIVYPLDPKRVSVYLGVPLCPAKCSYCSFVSTVADKKGRLAETYLSSLLLEIKAMARMVQEKELTIDTLYIGGGTPSILSKAQLEILLNALEGDFIHRDLREFTFEAGRPETTSREKLVLLKDYGVDRVCLNPQSMNAETLRAINRNHSPEDIRSTLEIIREVGFNSVNMDLIVGLAEESPQRVLDSLDAVIAMAPENLTVHSLAIKKGSAIKEAQGHQVTQLYDEDFYEEITQRTLAGGYHPYYLYRQKYTQGNGENIGYARTGYDGIYNILMMAERQTIIGIGAGSSGKVYHADTDRFGKIFTVKDIRTYNERIESIIERKIEAYSENLP